jgi:penicillin-binding protein 2
MEADSDRQKLLTRRALVLGGGQAALLGVLVGRMYYLQVIESDQYRMLAEENRISIRLLAPPRGYIYDRFGRDLASNRRNYRIVLVPEEAGDIGRILDRLAQFTDLDAAQREKILDQISRQRSFLPLTVDENLPWLAFARINIRSPDLPGVHPEAGQTRHYPFPEAFCHIVGYVGPVARDETSEDPLLQLPGFRVGKSGVERTADLFLRGRAGASRVEVNALGRVIRELAHNPGEPGNDVVLSVDADLQRFAVRRLQGESAAAVVIDVASGALMVLASTPGFDPNAFNVGIRSADWQALLTNPHTPLVNKALAGQYPPGSTFKMIVALAALEAGVVTPGDHVWCSGELKLGNQTFHCWKRRGHGSVDMIAAITQSCDIYFYEIARKVGIERIADMAFRFGLGRELGIEIGGEARGLVPTPEWKLGAVGTRWQQGETLISGIGQGFVLATPLQLAVMMARLVNGGRAVTPRLMLTGASRLATPEQLSEPAPEIGVSQSALAVIKVAMDAVVNSARGTAHRSRLRGVAANGMALSMGGKTGTSQVRRISKAERDTGVRKNKEKPWEERDHALFVGFGPVKAPRYAVAVVVEHGGGGSTVAAPIARDILRQTLEADPAGRPVYGAPETASKGEDTA